MKKDKHYLLLSILFSLCITSFSSANECSKAYSSRKTPSKAFTNISSNLRSQSADQFVSIMLHSLDTTDYPAINYYQLILGKVKKEIGNLTTENIDKIFNSASYENPAHQSILNRLNQFSQNLKEITAQIQISKNLKPSVKERIFGKTYSNEYRNMKKIDDLFSALKGDLEFLSGNLNSLEHEISIIQKQYDSIKSYESTYDKYYQLLTELNLALVTQQLNYPHLNNKINLK